MTDESTGAEPYKLLLDYLEQENYFTEAMPVEVLSGSGIGWFYCPSEKTMVQCRRGGELTRVPEPYITKLSFGYRVPVYYGNSAQLILVPKEEIVSLGFN